MKIATWNVNSVKARLPHLLSWLQNSKPDIALLQELKCTKESFPTEELEDLGYNLAIHGQKTYNGVAILSKFPIDDFTTILANDPEPAQARYIEAVISLNKSAIRVASVYVPNGGEIDSAKFEHKLKFYDALKSHMQHLTSLDEAIIIGGDYNVAPDDIDVYDPIALGNCTCFTQIERQKFKQLLRLGYSDAFRLTNRQAQEFSWWDYRAGSWHKNQGMRIDHLLLSPEATDLLKSSQIETNMRKLEKPSDHAPVSIILEPRH